MINFGSTVDPYNSYTTLTSYTENFIIVPDIIGWKYIPRKKLSKTKKNDK
tara:strand:+ start:42 stop:191 length:150 start_codon:yes stop_codon:yes gene_type:complete